MRTSLHRPAARVAARLASLMAASISGLVLVACGGGGGGGSGGGDPPATTLTISGTAATGAALAGAPVSATCAAGTGSATTGTDGRYEITVAGGRLPCALRVSATGVPALHGIATGSGSAAVAQLTPLTQLLVALLGAIDPGDYFEAFDASAASAVSTASLAQAESQLRALLDAAGIDLDAVGDVLSSTLRPGVAGDAYDGALEDLSQALSAANTTLPTLTDAVVVRARGATQPSTTAQLPAELLLRPAASDCTALRSGRYRIITPLPGATPDAQTGVAVFDATSGAITRSDGSEGTWSAEAGCRYLDSGGGWTATMIVSQSGVWYGRYSLDGGVTYRPILGLPEQVHTVAELAGTWQQLGLSEGSGAYVAFTGETGFDEDGKFVSGTDCRNAATWSVESCSTLGAPALDLFAPLQASSDGGFDITDAPSGTKVARLFAYRAGGGYLMLAAAGNSGFSLWTPKVSVALPAIGTESYNFNVNVDASLASPGTELTFNVVTSQDTAAGSWTRRQGLARSDVTYTTTLFADDPRQGLVFRPGGVVTASNGAPITLNEFTFLRLHGMGFSPTIIPGPKLLQFSGGVPPP